MMTYWLVGEEPWRTRRQMSHLELQETHTEPIVVMENTDRAIVHHHRNNNNNPADPILPSEMMDPIDSSSTTWLLANDDISQNNHHQIIISPDEVTGPMSPSKQSLCNNNSGVPSSGTTSGKHLLQSPSRFRSAVVIA